MKLYHTYNMVVSSILLIHYIGLTFFQQPIGAMQLNDAELQNQSCFKSCFKVAFEAASKVTQRSSSYAAFKNNMYSQRSAAAQRMCKRTNMRFSAARRSAAHHMLRLKATGIHSATQRMRERTFIDMTNIIPAH